MVTVIREPVTAPGTTVDAYVSILRKTSTSLSQSARYRAAGDSPSVLSAHVVALERAGAPVEALKAVQDWVGRRRAASDPKGQEAKAPEHVPEWISEKEVIGILERKWTTVPRVRLLRRYFHTLNACRHRGGGKTCVYDGVLVRKTSEQYVPVTDFVTADEIRQKAVRMTVKQFAAASIGNVKLVKADDAARLSRSMLPHRDKGLARSKTDESYCPKLTSHGGTGVAKGVERAA